MKLLFGDHKRAGKTFNRRRLLRSSLGAVGGLLAGFEIPAAPWLRGPTREHEPGKLVGTVPFTGESSVAMNQPLGDELDGRMYTDLSDLAPGNALTASKDFYIRTRVSHLLGAGKPWPIRIGGKLAKGLDLTANELHASAKPVGAHLMECAGNARSVHFGMMSVAEWTGVRVDEIFDRTKPTREATHVLVAGFDTYAASSASSVAGASWIFGLEELKATQAFLATEMNGSGLTPDHGAPVRLVVPGWYGCVCIKWVNEITLIGDAPQPTSQMQEYAARTMQTGMPKLARDYKPALIEPAAMPTRVEKWIVGEKIQYRVCGILWGGAVPVQRLQVRFNPDEDYVDVSHFEQQSNRTWSFWNHVWEPRQPGNYMIRLNVAEPRIAARRLEAGFYMRSVDIYEV